MKIFTVRETLTDGSHVFDVVIAYDDNSEKVKLHPVSKEDAELLVSKIFSSRRTRSGSSSAAIYNVIASWQGHHDHRWLDGPKFESSPLPSAVTLLFL